MVSGTRQTNVSLSIYFSGENDKNFFFFFRRPATSFLWFLNPWKSFRYIIWSHFKWYFVISVVLILVVLLFALFIYSAPVCIFYYCNFSVDHFYHGPQYLISSNSRLYKVSSRLLHWVIFE
jgi:hypothetical protein